MRLLLKILIGVVVVAVVVIVGVVSRDHDRRSQYAHRAGAGAGQGRHRPRPRRARRRAHRALAASARRADRRHAFQRTVGIGQGARARSNGSRSRRRWCRSFRGASSSRRSCSSSRRSPSRPTARARRTGNRRPATAATPSSGGKGGSSLAAAVAIGNVEISDGVVTYRDGPNAAVSRVTIEKLSLHPRALHLRPSRSTSAARSATCRSSSKATVGSFESLLAKALALSGRRERRGRRTAVRDRRPR